MEKPKLLMAVFIAVIMIMSTAGFIMNSSADEQTFVYNDFVFKVTRNDIFAKMDFGEVRFDFLPETVEQINVSEVVVYRVKSTKMISLTSDYNGSYSQAIGQAEYGLFYELQKSGVYSEVGFTEETDTARKITCADSTPFVPVLFFKEGETGIAMQGNCIIMSADSDVNFLKIKDRLLYSVFGIME